MVNVVILTCSVSSSEFCFWRTHLGAVLCHPKAVPPDGMAVDDSTAVRPLCHQRKDKRLADGQCRLPTPAPLRHVARPTCSKNCSQDLADLSIFLSSIWRSSSMVGRSAEGACACIEGDWLVDSIWRHMPNVHNVCGVDQRVAWFPCRRASFSIRCVWFLYSHVLALADRRRCGCQDILFEESFFNLWERHLHMLKSPKGSYYWSLGPWHEVMRWLILLQAS